MFKSMAAMVGGAVLIATTVASAAPTAERAETPEAASAVAQSPQRAAAAEAARLLTAARARPFQGFFARYRELVLASLERLVSSTQALEKATPAASQAAYALVVADYQAAKRVFAFMRPTPKQLLEMIMLGRSLTALDPARPNKTDARTDGSRAVYVEWEADDVHTAGGPLDNSES